jgi:hypothetical protein
MRRLLDSDLPPRFADADPSLSPALDLLRAATPYEAPPGRKQRVRAALVAARAPRRFHLVLRPVVVFGVLVSFGAIASAGLGHWPSWVRRAYERLVPAPAPVTVASAPPREHRTRRPRAPEIAAPEVEGPAAELVAPAAPAVPPATVLLPSRAGATVPRVATAARRHELATPRLRPAAAPDDAREQTGPVLAAMQALRRDHDPVRARALLDPYLARHPNGALAEEALAISIEAAAAHHDPDAPDLASRYLARYPTGPFSRLARQMLGQ